MILMKPPAKPEVMDWGYARLFSYWRCRVREIYPEAFATIDEGDRVIFDDGDPGTVTSVMYNPCSKTHYIVVLRGNQQYHFTSPSKLKIAVERTVSEDTRPKLQRAMV
jgi:hypothetical protein